MSQKEIFLEGNPPWGFRMNGGADAGHPLRISRVNPGSKAESKGVREGDLITSINGQPTKCLTNSESHALLRTVKENLILGLNEDKNESPRRRSREIKSASIISQEKERSESPAQIKGNRKPSASQKRHQRRTRLKHRIKEIFGFKTKEKKETDDQNWVIVDASLETRSATDSLPDEKRNISFFRANSEPCQNDFEEVYDNFDFKTSTPVSYRKNEISSTSPSPDIKSTEYVNDIEVSTKSINATSSSSIKNKNISNVGEFHYHNVGRQFPEEQVLPIPYRRESENVCLNDVSQDQGYGSIITQRSISFESEVHDEKCALEQHISSSEDLTETLNTLPANEKVEVCNATVTIEKDNIANSILIDEEEILPKTNCQTVNSDYEPVEVNSSVIVYPPYSSTISYYFPQRRYLEAITEETSDLSENNEDKMDRPWENSDLIREANNISSIPNDWFGSDEGIDTSWRDGKSIEEVSDVPIVSDSHSDSDYIGEEHRIAKVLNKDIKKDVSDSICKTKKCDILVTKPPIKSGHTNKSHGNVTSAVTHHFDKKSPQPEKKMEMLSTKTNENEPVTQVKNSKNKVTCKILHQTELVQKVSDVQLGKEELSESGLLPLKDVGVNRKETGRKQNEDKINDTKNIESQSSKQKTLSCRIIEQDKIHKDDKAPKKLSNEIISSAEPKNNNATSYLKNDTNKQEKKYVNNISTDVLKNVVSAYYNNTKSNTKSISQDEVSQINRKTKIELNTAIIEPFSEKEVELIYIDSSDSNRTSASFDKEDDVLEPFDKNNSVVGVKDAENIIKEVINIKKSVKEITNSCFEATEMKKTAPIKQNKAKLIKDVIINPLSPVLGRKEPLLEPTLRRYSYPLSEQEVHLNLLKDNKLIGNKIKVSNSSQENTYNNILQSPEIIYGVMDNVQMTKLPLKTTQSPSSNQLCVGSGKEEFRSSESIFVDNSEGSISSESYTLPDITLDNNWTDSSSETLKLFYLPANNPKLVSQSPVEVSNIVDLHKKFVERRGYHESSPKMKRKTPQDNVKTQEPDLIALSKCKDDNEQAYTPELLAEAANLLALHKYHESRQQKMLQNGDEKKMESYKVQMSNDNQPKQSESYKIPVNSKVSVQIEKKFEKSSKTPTDSSDNGKFIIIKPINTPVSLRNETVGKSRLLELLQNLKSKSSNSECTLPEPSPYWLILGNDPELDNVKKLAEEFNVSCCDFRNEHKKSNNLEENDFGEGEKIKIKKSLEVSSSNIKKEVTSKLHGTSSQLNLKSMPPGEIFQQKMYEEYLGKMAELAERRNLKVIKISSGPSSVNLPSERQPLESEFMNKLKERNEKLGIIIDGEDRTINTNENPKKIDDLPKHLKELMEITEECGGVWSPAQTPEAERKQFDFSNDIKEDIEKKKEEEEPKEPQPAVWTPRSAGASPTLERKFRVVNFQSPPPTRKEFRTTNETPVLPKELPITENKDSNLRLTTSSSENSSLSSSLRLPPAQNPTITLLQKAREGQIPRGAQYIDDHPAVGPDEIIYSVKKEQVIDESNRKVLELGPKRIEGIGPITKEGIPTVLRSEVKEDNQQRWYKRMYDSLHRADYDSPFQYSYSGGYSSEPERIGYDSDASLSKYATLDRRKIRNKENDFTTSTMPRNRYGPGIKYAVNVYKNQPGKIEDYEPGHSSIADKETEQWWDTLLEMFDGELNEPPRNNHLPLKLGRPHTYSLKDTGYESDSTLIFKRRENNMNSQLLSPAEQKMAYKVIQKGGEVPLQGLRKAAPERPKESPHRYVESEVNIHYRSPVRREAKAAWPEDELAQRQAEIMRRIYQEQKRTKYLNELQDMYSRRHADNLLPSQKSPIPLNRYDDFPVEVQPPRPRDRTPEPKLVARARYNFVGQSSRELSFRRGDIIYVRRQIDKNWYEGEHNAMIGLFPFNYVEIIPYDGIRTLPKKANEGQARAKFNFQAQTHLELSLVKGELVLLTRRVDENWFEGRIGNRKGIFPVSYVEVLVEPGERAVSPSGCSTPSKPVVAPASHSVMLNGAKDIGQQHYQPPRPAIYTTSSLPPSSKINDISLVNQTLHIDTQSDPVPYRVMYNYRPQNEDELELKEGDVVYVMEKCDDGWYVGSLHRNGQFGTFPGNYVERIQ